MLDKPFNLRKYLIMSRQVLEDDFRLPEYRGKDPADYEFRKDGVLVRKDRWEAAVRRIAEITGMNTASFEIDDVVDAVIQLKSSADILVISPDQYDN